MSSTQTFVFGILMATAGWIAGASVVRRYWIQRVELWRCAAMKYRKELAQAKADNPRPYTRPELIR